MKNVFGEKVVKSFKFYVVLRRPSAQTFGAIVPVHPDSHDAKSLHFKDFDKLPEKDLTKVVTDYNAEFFRFQIFADSYAAAERKIREFNPGLKEVGRPKSWKDKQKRYWSYSK